jgi:hypothetical protein
MLIIFLTTTAFAENQCRVEFFASNNTGTISIQTAYQRLIGDEQHKLQDSMTTVLQENRIEQGTFENILGTYQMADNGNITADNTDAFITSPYQCINERKIFSIAKQLANTLKQESVAVLIASQQPVIGELKVSFTASNPTVIDVITLIHAKLPPIYTQAFSLHLTNENADFDHAKVADIEWLGSKININDVNTAFPNDKISFLYGTAYLVYKNGQKDQL